MAASGSAEAHLLLHCLGGSFDGQCSLPGEGTDMPVSVWGNFPVDLLQNIVTRLPPTSLARFRAVAKRWRDFLSSPEAKKLVMMALPVCALEYRPASSRASAGTLPSSPAASAGKDTAVIKLALCYLPPAYHGCGKQDFFVGDGLVCFRAYVDGFWRFCVVNPMTRKYQELPQRLVGRTESKKKPMLVRLCNMAVETSPLELSFRVLVASRPWDANAATVFSSETGRWKRLSQWRHERQYECQLDDEHNYHVSSKRVVAVYGATEVCFLYEEGVDKAKQTGPSHLNYRSYIDPAVETVQVQNELFCVEQPKMSECESELTWGVDSARKS